MGSAPASSRPAEATITPMEVPAEARGLLLVGGTFDPPHVAHAQMAEAARTWVEGRGGWTPGSVQIVLVPAARSPFKPPPIAGDADRVAMLRAMARAIPGATVWTDEIDRAHPSQPSYWVDTLRRAHTELARRAREGGGRRGLSPPPALSFLIGADQAIALHRWREARRVLELARPVIVAREPVSTPELLARALRAAEFWGQGEIGYLVSRVAPCALSAASATAIREGLARGDAMAAACLHPEVWRVIQERRLYAR